MINNSISVLWDTQDIKQKPYKKYWFNI